MGLSNLVVGDMIIFSITDARIEDDGLRGGSRTHVGYDGCQCSMDGILLEPSQTELFFEVKTQLYLCELCRCHDIIVN